MTELIIDPELRDWIIPLSIEEYSNLEKSILEDGCRDPIVIWKGIVVDGHNRYSICSKYKLPFTTVNKEFVDKDEVKIWMVTNQLSRRNLIPIQRIALTMKSEELIAKKAKKNYENNVGRPTKESSVILHPINKIKTSIEAAKQADVSERTYDKGKYIMQKAPQEIVKKVVSGDISIHRAYTDIKREEKKAERIADIILNPVVPTGTFNIILADPPWRYENATPDRRIENQYPTMETNDICNLSLPIEENAVLFLWATAPKLKDALKVMESWGFEYKTNAVWDKEIIGMGYYFRGQHELLLIGVKGTMITPIAEDRVSSIIKSRRTEHSKKPEIVYNIIEKLYPNKKYLEVFARNTRNGWSSWGNQIAS